MCLANPDCSTEPNSSPTLTGVNFTRRLRSAAKFAVCGSSDDGIMSGMMGKLKSTIPKSRRRRRRRRRKPPIDETGAEAVGVAPEWTQLSDSTKSNLPPPPMSSSSPTLTVSSSSSSSSSTSLRCPQASPRSPPVALRLLPTSLLPASAASAPIVCPNPSQGHPSKLRLGRRTPSSAKLLRHWLWLMVLLIASANAYINEELVVQTNKGKVRGVTLKSATQR